MAGWDEEAWVVGREWVDLDQGWADREWVGPEWADSVRAPVEWVALVVDSGGRVVGWVGDPWG